MILPPRLPSLIQPIAESDCWQTPPSLLDVFREHLGPILFDPCSAPDNPTQAKLFCHGDDPAESYLDWPIGDSFKDFNVYDGRVGSKHGFVWVNHPYSQNKTWAAHVNRYVALHNAPTTIMIGPASTSAEWFQDCARSATFCYFPAKRVTFLDPSTKLPGKGGTKWPSVIFGWRFQQDGDLTLGEKLDAYFGKKGFVAKRSDLVKRGTI